MKNLGDHPMRKAVKYTLILVMFLLPTGCVDLFFAKDFTCGKFNPTDFAISIAHSL